MSSRLFPTLFVCASILDLTYHRRHSVALYLILNMPITSPFSRQLAMGPSTEPKFDFRMLLCKDSEPKEDSVKIERMLTCFIAWSSSSAQARTFSSLLPQPTCPPLTTPQPPRKAPPHPQSHPHPRPQPRNLRPRLQILHAFPPPRLFKRQRTPRALLPRRPHGRISGVRQGYTEQCQSADRHLRVRESGACAREALCAEEE